MTGVQTCALPICSLATVKEFFSQLQKVEPQNFKAFTLGGKDAQDDGIYDRKFMERIARNEVEKTVLGRTAECSAIYHQPKRPKKREN